MTEIQAAEWQQKRESERVAPHFHNQANKARLRKAADINRFNAILLHIARRYNYHHEFALHGLAYNNWIIGKGYAGESVWHNYTRCTRLMKWMPGSNGVQQVFNGSGRSVIRLSTTNGRIQDLPDIPKRLLRHIDLSEPHPIGYFCVPVKHRPELFACYGLATDYIRIRPDLKIHDDRARWERADRWVIVGFCVKGHRVPECYARGTMRLYDIESERNDETKRLMIEWYGLERYIRESEMVPVQSDDWGTLYDLGTHKVVRLVNSTMNSDGTFNEYFRRCPSSVETAHEAVAWSFGLTTDTYQPVEQS